MSTSSSREGSPASGDAGGKLKITIPVFPPWLVYETEVRPDSAVGRFWKRSSPVGRALTALGLALLVGLVGLGGWRFFVKPDAPPPPAESPDHYAVRVVPVDAEGRPVLGTEVHASTGNEPQSVAGGWEVEIPRAKVPDDGKVTFRVQDPASAGFGSTELVLGEDPTPSVTVPLTVTAASVRGTVVDSEGRALAGARVSVDGHGEEAVVTDATGTFVLDAHRPRGHRVRLRAESAGLPPVEHYCFAGSDQCRLEIRED